MEELCQLVRKQKNEIDFLNDRIQIYALWNEERKEVNTDMVVNGDKIKNLIEQFWAQTKIIKILEEKVDTLEKKLKISEHESCWLWSVAKWSSESSTKNKRRKLDIN